MKLFFETARQGAVFLMVVPIGMLLAFVIDICSYTTCARPVWDVIVMLLGFATVGIGIVLLGDTQLRMYHLLAVLIGSILYMLGIRRAFRYLWGRIKNRKKDGKPGRKSRVQVE